MLTSLFSLALCTFHTHTHTHIHLFTTNTGTNSLSPSVHGKTHLRLIQGSAPSNHTPVRQSHALTRDKADVPDEHSNHTHFSHIIIHIRTRENTDTDSEPLLSCYLDHLTYLNHIIPIKYTSAHLRPKNDKKQYLYLLNY